MTLSDYNEVRQLIEKSIPGGASVSAQARLWRVIGEIHHHCGNNQHAIEHLERAIKLDPSIGVKKLLARLKAEKNKLNLMGTTLITLIEASAAHIRAHPLPSGLRVYDDRMWFRDPSR